MIYIVTEGHVSNYPDPIKLKCGDQVMVLERHNGSEGWDNWISCISKETGSKGWVPEQIIKIEEDKAYVIEDYDASELSISPGVRVKEIKKLNGWVWCQNCDTDDYYDSKEPPFRWVGRHPSGDFRAMAPIMESL